MFSEELAELDRNTVQLMIDEMQDEINAQKKELEEQSEVIKNKDKVIEDKDKAIEEKNKKLQKMIHVIYAATQDVNQVAELLGYSVEEVKVAIADEII